ncbi:unnamed protein product [Spirodela intermedia]|uniref:Uncharacterized protein n=2 Tax=Spirodela intermedia TaxID=51605 RepID=A0A7I8JM35_SPIIN|nr:unnamed protein product [Spirodela intermedia]CAA6671199.1 unnamed protein product [Spirodela intermedia]CAA7408307.1 unnamed protein product [Spirodela intermedia]
MFEDYVTRTRVTIGKRHRGEGHIFSSKIN